MTQTTKKRTRYLKVVKWIEWDTVRNICIRNNWYTRGTTEEYMKLHDYIMEHRNYTEESILYIATDIYNHSNFSEFEGASDIEFIEGITFDLIGGLDYYVEIEVR